MYFGGIRNDSSLVEKSLTQVQHDGGTRSFLTWTKTRQWLIWHPNMSLEVAEVLQENLFDLLRIKSMFSVTARVEDDTNTVQSALCTRMRIVFTEIRLGPKTSVHEKDVTVVSTAVSVCDVTDCATT